MTKPKDISLHRKLCHCGRCKTIPSRLLSSVVMQEGCWVWIRAINGSGYGTMAINGITQRSHRASWIIHRGKIPKGLSVLHRCDNPPCINPDHLFLGTQLDNLTDMKVKLRSTFGEKSSSAVLSEKQVIKIIQRSATGESMTSISKDYPCKYNTIVAILSGKTWKYLDRPVREGT